MTLVDSDQSELIYRETKGYQKDMTTGGSAANTMHGLASLGGNCGYAGKIGDDDLGKLFKGEFHAKNIQTFLPFSKLDTGRVMAMVSPDSERTMATYLGAAADLIPSEFNASMMHGYDILYIEGYLVQNHRLIETIVVTAYEAGLKVAIDLSSYNIVEQNLEFLKGLITGFIDIVFANEEEALAFTGEKPYRALSLIASVAELAIVKTGKNGSLIQTGSDIFTIAPVHTVPVDTTGAGDAYAAGFLYGLTKGEKLTTCGEIASLVSSKAVETIGAKIPEESWPEVLQKVRTIEARV
jgi:sugar/nucleoside kinase (ribokinase family)